MSATIRRAWRRATADRKKLTLVLGLSAVMMLMWGRLLLKQTPREAAAGQAVTASGDAPPVAVAGAMALPRGPSRRTVTVDLPARLERDLFTFHAQAYPLLEEPAETSSNEEKSEVARADDILGPQERARQAARGLVLQTTILGEAPRAMINGRFLVKGNRINGLELRDVLPHEVVLVMDGIEIRLSM